MITVDIQRFSTHLAAIYANIAKPVLYVILYNYQLSQNVGAEGLVLLTGLVQLSAALRAFLHMKVKAFLNKLIFNSESSHTAVRKVYGGRGGFGWRIPSFSRTVI